MKGLKGYWCAQRPGLFVRQCSVGRAIGEGEVSTVETPSGTGREEPGGKAEAVESCRCLDRMYEAARGKL